MVWFINVFVLELCQAHNGIELFHPYLAEIDCVWYQW